jgi:alpha-galactosidase
LRIVVGDRIALTPPMGWNSWNIWGSSVTQDKVRKAADALVASGLRDHGWTYVNIDDGWQGVRGGEFNAIMPNAKFPDMAALSEQVHAMGLKLGIYSSPWRTSFAGHLGSSADHADGSTDWLRAGTHNEHFKFKYPKHESWMERYAWLKPLSERAKDKSRGRISKKLRTFGKFSFVDADVRQWSAWGIDYLKYDWVPIDAEHTREMRQSLEGSRARYRLHGLEQRALFRSAAARDASERMAHIRRREGRVGRPERDRLLARSLGAVQRAGSYNDPDMLLVGQVGWGKPRPTRLTPNEQYTQMSLWSLLAAPLLLGCDLDKLDPFTLGLLTNDEVLAVNQDPLCKQATRVARSADAEIFAKLLEDGSWAVGLFNRGEKERTVAIRWSHIGIEGAQVVRDLWRQQDVGRFVDRFEAPVQPHGVALVKITPAR